MTDPRRLIETTLIPHEAFQAASKKLGQCFTYADGACEPICVALVGESRTGKTRALEECCARYAAVRDPDGLKTPILRVKTPSKPTVKSLAELMLRAMGDPLFDKGTENSKTIRLQILMRKSETVMVMIDEFQHFVDKGSHRVMHHVADWLKTLVDDSRVALVVAGLPTCQAVLEQNEQLSGRFLAPVFMPRFDWQNDDHREEFVAILGAFHESMSAYFDLPELDSTEMAFRCYCATGGLIGYLSKFLRQAVWNALDNEQRSISLAELMKAHDESIWAQDGPLGIANPFSRNFSVTPTTDLISRIKQLGTPIEPIVVPRKQRMRGMGELNARNVLSAS